MLHISTCQCPELDIQKCTNETYDMALRGGIKKLFFSSEKLRKGGGGGLAESEISLSEKTEIFLDFFFQKGGGLTYSKRVLS